MTARVASLVLLSGALTLAACRGELDAGVAPARGRPVAESPPIDAGDPIGTGGLRRLSPLEAEATVADLLAELGADGATAPPAPLPTPQHHHGFQNPLDPGQLGFEDVRGLLEWAEAISELATSDLAGAMGCAPGAAWDTCVSAYAAELARLAYRRPVDADELARFEAAYLAVVAETTPRDGVRALWELALISPDFWYVSAETIPDGSQLTPYAIAAQLAYGLWGTMPDAWLRARTNELTTRDGVRAVADQMLDDPRAARIVARFHEDWLNLARAETLDKDPARYPDFDAATAAALDVELDAFVTRAVLEDRPVAELFTSREAYVNRSLEQLYRLEPLSTGDDDWQWRELGAERAGILTRALVLATTAGRGESSIVHRGVTVLEHVLCRVLAPPPDAIAMAIAIPPDATSGKMAAVVDRASNPVCATCHDTIDPLGVAFETFDAIGAHRSAYPDGVAIEPAGTLEAGFVPETIEYTDAAELMASLGTTTEARLCYASSWSEWLTGTVPSAAQRAALEELIAEPGIGIREILLRTLTSPWFLDRAELER
jgi:hypothetical protein